MRASTLRRMLVLGVCAVGVAVYSVVPGLGQPLPPEPASQPRNGTEASSTGDADDPSAAELSTTDRMSPSTVTGLRLMFGDHQRMILTWNEARDNVAVVGYQVSLNGVPAAVVAHPPARVNWFNDDTTNHFVQVRALDEAGNSSRITLSLHLDRPRPTPKDEEASPETDASAAQPNGGRPDPADRVDPAGSADPTDSADPGHPADPAATGESTAPDSPTPAAPTPTSPGSESPSAGSPSPGVPSEPATPQPTPSPSDRPSNPAASARPSASGPTTAATRPSSTESSTTPKLRPSATRPGARHAGSAEPTGEASPR